MTSNATGPHASSLMHFQTENISDFDFNFDIEIISKKTKNLLIGLGILALLGGIATAVAAGLNPDDLGKGFEQMGQGLNTSFERIGDYGVLAGRHISDNWKTYTIVSSCVVVSAGVGLIIYGQYSKARLINELKNIRHLFGDISY